MSACFCRSCNRAFLVLLFALASCLPLTSVQAADEICQTALRERLNLAIGLYRVELSASHMVGQIQAAASNPGRLQQLQNAHRALAELKTGLQSQAANLLNDPDGRGRCRADQTTITAVHQALSDYAQVVDVRWQVMAQQLKIISTLSPGQPLPHMAEETQLWMHEPLMRYALWRAFASAATPRGEAASALYVMGMLTRFEWDVATALHAARSGQGDPRKGLANASASIARLRDTWPKSDSATNVDLWQLLQNVADAMPSAAIPTAPPPQGWEVWIAGWLQGYASVFTRSAPGILKAMEGQGLK